MEKPPEQPEKAKRPPIWDCESSLYDSFEKKSFERQLDSAITSRTLSMPHLSDGNHRRQVQVQVQAQAQTLSKKPSKISRSFQKLIRTLFKSKQNKNPLYLMQEHQSRDGFYVVYDRSGVLTTIPEGPEFDVLSPELRALVTRTSSERFTTSSSLGISCA